MITELVKVQCKGLTVKGERCKKEALDGEEYCNFHKNQSIFDVVAIDNETTSICCPYCGVAISKNEKTCPNCKSSFTEDKKEDYIYHPEIEENEKPDIDIIHRVEIIIVIIALLIIVGGIGYLIIQIYNFFIDIVGSSNADPYHIIIIVLTIITVIGIIKSKNNY